MKLNLKSTTKKWIAVGLATPIVALCVYPFGGMLAPIALVIMLFGLVPVERGTSTTIDDFLPHLVGAIEFGALIIFYPAAWVQLLLIAGVLITFGQPWLLNQSAVARRQQQRDRKERALEFYNTHVKIKLSPGTSEWQAEQGPPASVRIDVSMLEEGVKKEVVKLIEKPLSGWTVVVSDDRLDVYSRREFNDAHES